MANSFGYKKLFNDLFNDKYKNLSLSAIVLFCLIVDRMSLSINNDFKDKKGHYYIIFTNKEICEKCKCSHTKATKILRELEANNLIFRQKRGQGHADLIFITSNGQKVISFGKVKHNNDPDFIENKVKNQIDYYSLINRYNNELIDGFVFLITDIIQLNDDYVSVGNRKIPADIVKYRFKKLTAESIEYVIKSIEKNDKPIKNMRSYLFSCLYNSIDTAEIADYL